MPIQLLNTSQDRSMLSGFGVADRATGSAALASFGKRKNVSLLLPWMNQKLIRGTQ